MANENPNRRSQEPDEAGVSAVPAVRSTHADASQREDVVFDFDGLKIADLPGLSMILTAQQIAEERSAVVWLKDAPMHTWALLRALGVDGLFASFPPSPSQPD